MENQGIDLHLFNSKSNAFFNTLQADNKADLGHMSEYIKKFLNRTQETTGNTYK